MKQLLNELTNFLRELEDASVAEQESAEVLATAFLKIVQAQRLARQGGHGEPTAA